MNISNTSPKRTQKGCSGSDRALTFAYTVGEGIYINLTNRCTNDCVFCLRNNADSAYGSEVLWLLREPTPEEAADAVSNLYSDGIKEFVFCGYGEPMCRADVLLQTAKILKRRYPGIPIRINTNGQADLILKKDIVPEMAGLIDAVSISLNTPDAESYNAICKPVFGKIAYDALLDFGSRCVGVVKSVYFSVVRGPLSEDDIEKCRQIIEKTGAKLRVREYISENNQNETLK